MAFELLRYQKRITISGTHPLPCRIAAELFLLSKIVYLSPTSQKFGTGIGRSILTYIWMGEGMSKSNFGAYLLCLDVEPIFLFRSVHTTMALEVVKV